MDDHAAGKEDPQGGRRSLPAAADSPGKEQTPPEDDRVRERAGQECVVLARQVFDLQGSAPAEDDLFVVLFSDLVDSTALAERLDTEAYARQLLSRWGVVFRDLLKRESLAPPWRDLLLVLPHCLSNLL